MSPLSHLLLAGKVTTKIHLYTVENLEAPGGPVGGPEGCRALFGEIPLLSGLQSHLGEERDTGGRILGAMYASLST